MGERLSTQLEILVRERERMEELLMLDANWRALRLLDEREAAGEPVEAIDAAGLRANLGAVLGGSRLFAARAKLIETIELLSAAPPDDEATVIRATGVLTGAPRLASRIVLLTSPGSDSFRARVPMEVAATGESDHASASAASGVPAEIGVALDAAPVRQGEDHATPASAPPVPDPLELIDGLGRCAVEILQSHGVTRFAEIARWTSADAAVWHVRLDGLAEGHPSSWIEQAAVLSAGRDTHYAARVRRGEFASLVQEPAPEPARPRLSRIVLADPAGMQLAEPLAPETLAPESLALVSLPAEPLPTLASKQPPTGPGARLVSATELAMVLAKSAPTTPADMVPVVESPAPEHRNPRPAGMPPLSKLSFRRRGFNRPAAPIGDGHDGGEAGDSEVIVITRVAASEAEAAPPSNYRGEVEEASVTVIRSQDGPAFVRHQPVQPPVEEQRTVIRFLKALTGKS